MISSTQEIVMCSCVWQEKIWRSEIPGILLLRRYESGIAAYASETMTRDTGTPGGIIMEYTHRYNSPLGGITMASDGTALTGLWFDGQKYFADSLEAEHEEKMFPVFEQSDKWLDIYFSGRVPDFTPPLKMKTTEFRKAMWEIMLSIPYGQTMTYGEIADKIAKQKGVKQMSAQAVGGAVGHNSISIIIPCHRVVGACGSLTGYAGGIDKKAKLLEMEGADNRSCFDENYGQRLPYGGGLQI